MKEILIVSLGCCVGCQSGSRLCRRNGGLPTVAKLVALDRKQHLFYPTKIARAMRASIPMMKNEPAVSFRNIAARGDLLRDAIK